MRKILSRFLVISCILILAGCSKEKIQNESNKEKKQITPKILTCTIDKSNELNGLGTMGATIKSNIIDDVVVSMNVKMNLEITSEKITENYMSNFKIIFDNVCRDGFEGIKLAECNVTQNAKKINLDATVNETQFDDEKDTYNTINKAKEKFEKDGYTCLITDK